MDDQPANPIPPPSPEPPKTLGWIKWVIVIIFVALLSSIATYLVLRSQSKSQTPQPVVQTPPTATPTPDPTANWKTYTNSNYRFLMKYPSAWIISERKGDKVLSGNEPQLVVAFYNRSVADITAGEPGRIEINVVYYKPTTSASDFLKTLTSGYRLINERENIYVAEDSNLGLVTTSAFIINNKTGEIYQTNNTVLKEEKQGAKKYFDQILSTFKFTQ